VDSAPDTPPPHRGSKRITKAERLPAATFTVAILAALALAVVYWRGGQPQAEGILLAVVLGGIGAGMALWAQRFMPHGPFEEERGQIASSEEDVEGFVEDLERGSGGIARRGFLATLAAGALGALGVAALFPIRSLGPRPGKGLKETPYANAPKRLVNEQGRLVKATELAVDGVITCYPEGFVDDPDSPTLLIHLPRGVNNPKPGREDWSAGDLVAYSKLCSHMGCPVGLYQARSGLLLCPCHQSTFDVPNHCNPIFGPATRSLPQLPISVDGDGYVVATADFSDPVGPGFWDAGR
jgi:ubiquinol-cytochrome c reductase iron-sulfur subunit